MSHDNSERSAPATAVDLALAGLAEAADISASLLSDCLKALAPMIHAARVYDDDPSDSNALEVGLHRIATNDELLELGGVHGREAVTEACAVLRAALKSGSLTLNISAREIIDQDLH
jgi:hypothetical protein